jgi:subtilisin family serine protease
MCRKHWFWHPLLAVLCLAAGVTPARPQAIPENAEWMPGEVLFKLRLDAFHSSAFRSDLAPQGRTGLAAVDAELERLGSSTIQGLFSLDVNADRKREMGMDRVFLMRYAAAEAAPEAAARLSLLPEIEYAEVNSIGHGTFTPNDPTYNLQWGHRNRGQAVQADGDSVGTWDCDIDSNQAWDIQTGSFSVIVAVLDTGLDLGHPEFSGKVLSGWDFVNEDNDPSDDHGHGTCCAGIAAARGNDGAGVAGVAWGVRVLPVKVLNNFNNGTSEDLIQGIVFATDYGADILSMSLGGYGNGQTLYDAVRYAFNLDVTLFAATGNANNGTIGYPARWSEIIAVGAISPCNERKSPTSCDAENWWGSNYGTNLDMMGPGVLIHTTDIRGAGGFTAGDFMPNFNGTSAATPFCAGVAALILSQTYLPRDQLLSILTDSCDDLGAPGYDLETGFGRINAYVALRRVSGGVFVGPNFTGFEDGSYHWPYNTVLEGVTYVPPGNTVVVRPGIYDEATPWDINKHVQIDAIDGGVTIR